MTQLLRIGYEHVAGFIAGGVEAWRRAGLPVRSHPMAEVPYQGQSITSDREAIAYCRIGERSSHTWFFTPR